MYQDVGYVLQETNTARLMTKQDVVGTGGIHGSPSRKTSISKNSSHFDSGRKRSASVIPSHQNSKVEIKKMGISAPVGACKHCIDVKGESRQNIAKATFHFPLKYVLELFYNDENETEYFDLWNNFYTTEPSFIPFKEAYTTEKWSLDENNCCLKKTCKLTTPPAKLAFGLPASPTKVVQHHRCHFVNSKTFVYMTFSHSLEVPYGDYFRIDTLWKFTEKGNTTIVQVNCDIIFLKYALVKSVIVKTAIPPMVSNTKNTFNYFKRRARDYDSTLFQSIGENQGTANGVNSKLTQDLNNENNNNNDDSEYGYSASNSRFKYYYNEDQLPLLLITLAFLLSCAFAYLSAIISSLHYSQNILLNELAKTSNLLHAMITDDASAKALWKEMSHDSLIGIFTKQKHSLNELLHLTQSYHTKLGYIDGIINGNYHSKDSWFDTYNLGIFFVFVCGISLLLYSQVKGGLL